VHVRKEKKKCDDRLGRNTMRP